MRIALALSFSAVLLAGCSTDRSYTVTHERMTTAAIQAISEEAHVQSADVVRTDRDEKGGRVTYLEAPYIDYSKIKARVDSRGKDSCIPEFSVSITTDKVLFTRHQEWEQRIHELVFLKLRERKYVLSDPVAEGEPASKPGDMGAKTRTDAAKANPETTPKTDSPAKVEKDK
jgi:hypothetical protein